MTTIQPTQAGGVTIASLRQELANPVAFATGLHTTWGSFAPPTAVEPNPAAPAAGTRFDPTPAV